MILARIGRYRINMEHVSLVTDARLDGGRVYIAFNSDDEIILKGENADAFMTYIDGRIAFDISIPAETTEDQS